MNHVVDGSRKRKKLINWLVVGHAHNVRVCVCVCVECIALNKCIPYRHDGGRDDRFFLSFHTLGRSIYSALVVIIIISCDQKGGTDPEKRRRK